MTAPMLEDEGGGDLSPMASPSWRVTGWVRRATPALSSRLSLCVTVRPALGGRAGFALSSPVSHVPTSSRKPPLSVSSQSLPWASSHLCIHLSGVNAFQPNHPQPDPHLHIWSEHAASSDLPYWSKQVDFGILSSSQHLGDHFITSSFC